tara:strand:+ start:4035 stop:5357 length:1323 start_codon:yes stop_codon:yes gene_type:complete
MVSSRKMATKILNSFDTNNEKLSLIIERNFKNNHLPSSEIKRSRVIINEVIRRRGILDYIIEKCSRKRINQIQPKLRNILRIGCYELLFDNFIPDFASIHSIVDLSKKVINKKTGAMVNAVMRNIQRQHKNNPKWVDSIIKKKVHLGYPEWLVKKWTKQFGKLKTDRLCSNFLNKTSMFIRLDENQLEINDVINILNESNIELKQHNELKNFLEVIKGQDKIIDNELFKSGILSIQDPASGAVVSLVNPQIGDTILDVCAAPGTKSLLMSQKVGPNGKIFASDKNIKRVEKGINDVNRHKKDNISWSILDATKDEFPICKKILIDAPCTGTGVIGRRPDIKWRINKKDINTMARLQESILDHMSDFLMPGGKIIYSTCSLEFEENTEIVKKFLFKHQDFTILPSNALLPSSWVNSDGFLMTMPYESKTDALFAAILLKKK